MQLDTEHSEQEDTFDGIISTAGEGRWRSFSETTLTQWLALSWGNNPGKHCERSDGARIVFLWSLFRGSESKHPPNSLKLITTKTMVNTQITNATPITTKGTGSKLIGLKIQLNSNKNQLVKPKLEQIQITAFKISKTSD